MRKTVVSILLSGILCFAASAFCGCGDSKYTLSVGGETDLLYAPLDPSYAAGETVTVKTGLLCDAVTVVALNGVELPHTPVKENDVYTHWEFVFTMPDENTVLSIKTTDGFLEPNYTVVESKLAYSDLDLTSDGETTGFKMNAYVHSLAMWNNIKPLLPDFRSDHGEEFFSSRALLVFFGEKGSGGDFPLSDPEVILKDGRLIARLSLEPSDEIYDTPTVMTEWAVVIEIENNIFFTDIGVEYDF